MFDPKNYRYLESSLKIYANLKIGRKLSFLNNYQTILLNLEVRSNDHQGTNTNQYHLKFTIAL